MASAVRLDLRVDGAKDLNRALKALGADDAPYLRKALEDSSELLGRAAARRTHTSIAQSIEIKAVRGRANRLKGVITFKHPGARSREFGRKFYYRDFVQRRMREGVRFRSSPGQAAQPFLGIVSGGGAIGATKHQIEANITKAIAREWERLAARGGV